MNTWILVNIFAPFFVKTVQLKFNEQLVASWSKGRVDAVVRGHSPSTNVTQVQFGTGCHLWVEFAGFFPG